MTNIYLRRPKQPFTFWKLIVFGSLFLLILDYIASLSNSISVFWFGILLGCAIVIRMNITENLSSFIKILGGIGLSLLISLIATSILWGYCFAQPVQDFCAPRYLRAFALSNFFFPLVFIFGWIVGEIYTLIKIKDRYK